MKSEWRAGARHIHTLMACGRDLCGPRSRSTVCNRLVSRSAEAPQEPSATYHPVKLLPFDRSGPASIACGASRSRFAPGLYPLGRAKETGSGSRNRTDDLQIMTLVSCHCSTPRQAFLSRTRREEEPQLRRRGPRPGTAGSHQPLRTAVGQHESRRLSGHHRARPRSRTHSRL